MNKVVHYKEIMETIEEYHSIIILRHQNPDPDALGSQLGLKSLLKAKYPDKVIYALGDMPDDLLFIGSMDQPVTEDIFQHSLVIITDTANQPRIDTPYPLEMAPKTIKIDHHPDVDQYADMQYVDSNTSSCSEIIGDISFTLQDGLPMNEQAATLLAAGIIGDTGRFLYPSTSSETFRIMSKLASFGSKHSKVANQMITRPRNVAKLSGYIYQNLEISEQGVANILLTKDLLDEFGVKDSETSSLVSLPGTIEGVKCWGIFVEKDGFYRCRLRSKGVIINDIAARHEGGGHPLASGANAHSIEEIKEILKEMEQKVLEN
ncbi:phosphoesterase RecJ domain-containing protein [Granulicatella balaenopterae]|uniref:Phosphoesterase RecJ domain-containing protein n=1 Tax=Granulicatella balaenopterae TaxID=137733 RepID=A0A1H9K7E2_9LACT|nr:bifunctional oligoribonuclease/PAP phosphatase NrnA [Granulicatella balaenopterae]SEQ95054.1 phosphoesterase RecJ domain-containing protein [Granulicatella balaenopterae]